MGSGCRVVMVFVAEGVLNLNVTVGVVLAANRVYPVNKDSLLFACKQAATVQVSTGWCADVKTPKI